MTGAPFTHDFVELFNRGDQPVNLAGWSVQYASQTGTNWLPAAPLPNVVLQPGQYFLIQFASNGNVGSPLPTPDFIAPVLDPEGFIPNLSSTTGKLALVNNSTRLPASACPSSSSIIDFVGYGPNVSCFEGQPTPVLSVTTAGRRNGNGCTDTDNNASDFSIAAPAPRNTSSATNACGLGGTLQASGAAEPTNVAPGEFVLLTVTVIPATSPPSSGITVNANLTGIGGPSNQQFFDDGTNGDETADDNRFSFMATVPQNASVGLRNIPVTVTDAQSRSASATITFNVTVPPDPSVHLLLGNPSNATTDVNNPTNYLLVKSQWVASYHRDRGIPNWVAWHLDSSWLGSSGRQDDFRPDTSLPQGWYQVVPADYSGSGFDRGHYCPSGDRTKTVADNSATFLMTNMMPQAPANNQGPWAQLEDYCRTLATQGNELYIIAGTHGIGGTGTNGGVTNTIANGKVTVPNRTWKIIVVLPNGNDDLNRITKTTRVIAVNMPNSQSIGQSTPWRNFRTTVRQIEALTGHNFFTNVRPNIRQVLKTKRDNQ
jgi:DNA/RNA endonuclease G (NUC1)